MGKIFSNNWVQFGLIVLGITFFISGVYLAFTSGAKTETKTRLKRVDDTLANMRPSDENHVQLLALRTQLLSKLNGI